MNWGEIAGAFLANCRGYEPPTPKTERRSYQHFLWPVLGLVTVIAISCGCLAWKTNEARQQREAVKAIEALGGYVVYDHEVDDDDDIDAATLPGPAWLRRLE